MPKAKNRIVSAPSAAADPFLQNLQKFDHLVILMMENRSFDHMLGYLSLTGGRTDVDGLKGGEANDYRPTPAAPPVTVTVHRLTSPTLLASQDPCHDGACVDQQVSGRNGGFVQNYHDTHRDDPDPGIVMGHYDGADLPTYDFLAREYAIGDRWFASVLGATWPNRLYLTSGKAAGSRDNRGKFSGTQYRNKSWVRQLDAAGVSWKGYGDAAYGHCSIKFTDANYRSSINYEPFGGSLTGFGFLRDCETGQLPAVSLIDPTFFKDDDHPPADIGLGQAFVARTYNALAKSPAWNRTLLVVVYDEHGGFFDHVPPDKAEDDDPDCRSYGVRVPVFFIGPFVPKGRCFHTTWDHASIVKTILTRFCSKDGSLPDLGARVAAASHIGEVLSETVARASVPMPLPTVKNLLAQRAHIALAEYTDGPANTPTSDDEHLLIRTVRHLQASAGTKGGGKKAPGLEALRRKADAG